MIKRVQYKVVYRCNKLTVNYKSFSLSFSFSIFYILRNKEHTLYSGHVQTFSFTGIIAVLPVENKCMQRFKLFFFFFSWSKNGHTRRKMAWVNPGLNCSQERFSWETEHLYTFPQFNFSWRTRRSGEGEKVFMPSRDQGHPSLE